MAPSEINVGQISDLIRDTSSLISLPEIYLKIKQLMDDDLSDIEDFAGVVSMDANLASVVLKVVNSPFYGFSGQIQAIDRAVNLLGIGQLHDLVLALSAVDAIKVDNDIEPLKTFWKRCIYCGVMARLLAEERGAKDAPTMFVIGLLHEVGHMLLYIKHPHAIKTAIDLALEKNAPLANSELQLFGFHYGQVGADLMESWNLPSKFQQITRHHIQPDAAPEDFRMDASIMGLSHKLASNLHRGADPHEFIEGEIDPQDIGIDKDTIDSLLPRAEELSRDMESMIIRN